MFLPDLWEWGTQEQYDPYSSSLTVSFFPSSLFAIPDFDVFLTFKPYFLGNWIPMENTM